MNGINVDEFIAARWYYAGRARRCRLVVIHATQSPERKGAARGVARDFATRPAANKASAHITCDADETIESVKPDDTAFAAPSANADGYHIEQVGYSEQTLDEWGDDYSTRVITRTADRVREACEYFDIPKVWLTVEEVRAGAAGITDHNTLSLALGGTHWDPGPYYHRDRLMALVLEIPPLPLPEEEDMTPAVEWVRNHTQMWVAGPGTDGACWVRVWTEPHDGKPGKWGDWFSIGGALVAGVDLSEGDGGRVDIVTIGSDHAFWQKTSFPDGTWDEWHSLGGAAA